MLGYPQLSLGKNDIVTFVSEREPSSIITYSLNSEMYIDTLTASLSAICAEGLSNIMTTTLEAQQSMQVLASETKTHIKHKFYDAVGPSGDTESAKVKFVCTSYFAPQVCCHIVDFEA